MTIRLSIISLAGMARTLVAVGTSSDADMFLTTAAAAPRSTCTSSPSAGFGAAGGLGWWLLGCFLRLPWALAGGRQRRWARRAGVGGRVRAPAAGGGLGRCGRVPMAVRCRPRLGVVGWLGGVVDEELMPTGIYRRGILAELAIHLLDQPLVLSEW